MTRRRSPARECGVTISIAASSELAELEPAWRDAAVAARNLFVTPEWLFEYLDHVPAARAAVVVARDAEERPIALLPLVEERRLVTFPGAEHGDRFEPLALAPGARLGRLWQTMLASLGKVFGHKLVVLTKLDTTFVSAAYRTRHFSDVVQALPYFRLDGLTESEWLASRSANFRSEVRRKGRAMKREGFEFVAVDDLDAVPRAVERHFELHDRRWETLEGLSSLGSETARSFHAGLARRIAARGWLRLWFLERESEVAASWYGWNLGGRYAYYQAGFDPRWGRHSPGTLLLARTVEAALSEGASEYDLLLGDERYKSRFATESRYVQSIALAGTPSPQSVRTYGVFALRRLHRTLPVRAQEATHRFIQSSPGLSRALSPTR